MKILITGGAGFIGSHIADRYLELGHEVVVVDDLSCGKRENIPNGAKFYLIDITDRPAMEKIIREEKPETINHHAAQKDLRLSTEKPLEDAKTNIMGTLNLLELAKKYGVKRFIFASTGGAIYGETEKIPTDESLQANPLSPYGIAKLSVEHYCRFFGDEGILVPVMLRYANVYGPRQDPHGEAGVVAIFINKLLANEEPKIFGDGQQTRDYVYVGDVVEANVRALEAGDGKTINIGTENETSVNELYGKICQIMESRTEAKHEEAKQGEVKRSCLAIGLAKEVLDWEPKLTLEEGLKKTVELMKDKS